MISAVGLSALQLNIVIHNYRWRLGLVEGDRQYDGPEFNHA